MYDTSEQAAKFSERPKEQECWAGKIIYEALKKKIEGLDWGRYKAVVTFDGRFIQQGTQIRNFNIECERTAK